ncbi:MAG: PQQ-dependent sugar dehydrogenase [Flavobacteriales bacterium]|nr:PQQ-dependent sugar dehydrogenase [Flavobacteriales bacterium]
MLAAGYAIAQSVPPEFNDAVVVSGFSEPVGFTFDANGRAYVWEKAGKVWIVENGVKLPAPLIDISEEVGNWRDHGCLGFALDPNFLTNGYIYLFYTVDRHYLMNYGTGSYNAATNEYYNATIMRLARYTAIGPAFNSVSPASRLVLIGETRQTGIPLLHESHSTGMLAFGSDGTLLLTVGDGASYNAVDVGSDPQTYYAQALTDSIMRPEENVGAMRSQLLGSMNGKILRVDPATGNGVPSNPFYNASAPRSPQSRVWALGLRNPFRFTRRPGTGSTDPAAADPGVFYIGDVGWSTYEEMNVCYTGRQNFGWPLFEGMDAQAGYVAALTQNQDAPNPLYGQGGCSKAYFDFQDLIVQETPTHPAGLPNPCDPDQLIPPNIAVFMHSRPVLDWAHGFQSRCSAFNGGSAVAYDLDDIASPVPGPRFGGNASVGGTFIQGNGWPVGYQNSYFMADYGGAWLRRVTMSAGDQAQQVFDFGTNMGALVFAREGPDGALWYVRYETGQVRKVSPLGYTNLPPVAVAGQDLQFGPGPLNVQFTGTNSTDPENGPLTYYWDFGDGGNSTSANPLHQFTAPPGVPTTYSVSLTVRDDQNQPNTASLLVSVNNTPPTVAITSFPDGQYYPVGVDSTFALVASVSDAQSSNGQLAYGWQTVLHHNNHAHPEPVDTAASSSTVISGVGCYGEDYHYEVILTVTDPGGLSTTVVHQLLPHCTAIRPTAVVIASVQQGLVPFSSSLDGTQSMDNGTVVSYQWDFGDGTTATGAVVNKTFTETGEYQVKLTVTDNDGLSASTVAVIRGYNMDPPQCVGASGSVLREYWNNISGTAISNLLSAPEYPDDPSGTTYPTSIRGPVNNGNNFGTRIRGYIIPSVSGDHTFNLTSDDAGLFYLSPNAEPMLKQLTCEVPGYTGDTEYGKYPSQQSGNITLVAGKYYYFEVLQKEGSGGDHVTVRWTQPGNPALSVVGGSNVARWADCKANLSLRVVLDGADDPATGLMRDDLRAQGLIPLLEPYTALGYAQAGDGGGETVAPSRLSQSGKNAPVDWVLVELRDIEDPAELEATMCALVQRDGDVVDTGGYGKLVLNVSAGDYYVAVRHRNHLGAMASALVRVDKYGTMVDFTKPELATYGSGARRTAAPGRMTLWSGNGVADAELKYTGPGNDRDQVLLQIGTGVPTDQAAGYFLADHNMDGFVRYTGLWNDRDLILLNIGGSNPLTVRTQQLP